MKIKIKIKIKNWAEQMVEVDDSGTGSGCGRGGRGCGGGENPELRKFGKQQHEKGRRKDEFIFFILFASLL